MYTGAAGAALGGVLGITESGEAADVQEDKLIAKYEQFQAREERLDRLRTVQARQKDAFDRQTVAMQTPTRGLPMGRGAQPQGPAMG